jgi:hypothetical protein
MSTIKSLKIKREKLGCVLVSFAFEILSASCKCLSYENIFWDSSF